MFMDITYKMQTVVPDQPEGDASCQKGCLDNSARSA